MGKLAELSTYTALIHQLDAQKNENEFDARRYVHFEHENDKEINFAIKTDERTIHLECKFGRIGSKTKDVIYLTQSTFSENELPLAVFLMDPKASLDFMRKMQ
jgi:hypothetical protein